jgi:hypothetical protein
VPEEDHITLGANASVEFSDQIQIEDLGIFEVVRRIWAHGATLADDSA